MVLGDLVLNHRSYGRFHQEIAVGLETLKRLVDLARQLASGSNLQPTEFILSADLDTSVVRLASWRLPSD